MKSRYRKKGKYRDHRIKIAIEYQEDNKIKTLILPKPEKLLSLLKRTLLDEEKASK